ncbi:MAG: phosphatase PAP2 family protein [Candidatus Aenigmarchaeota archaeon]|nr:phosphatase PAP2 family protein [Candidatus Aenigmarchaeota archaeon]
MDEAFWGTVTSLGDPVIWSLIVIVLIFVHFLMERKVIRFRNSDKYRRVLKNFLLLIVPTLFLALLSSEALKMFFQVPRPCIPCPAAGCNPFCLSSYSFPSGHSATMTSIATALFLLLRKRKRYLVIFVFPIAIGLSRLALGVHTVFDVAGGFALGLLVTVLVWKMRKSIYKWEDEVL